MKKMRSISLHIAMRWMLLLGIFSFGGHPHAWAQDDEETEEAFDGYAEEENADGEENVPFVYQEREFDQKKLEELRENPDYYYERKAGRSLWDQFLEWLGRLFDREVDPEPREELRPPPDFSGMNVVLQTILWIIIAALVVFLLIQLLKVDFRKLVRKKSDDGNVDYDVREEVLEKLPFEELIQDAIARGQYRMAVRFHYLRSLKYLQDSQYIVWKFEKTNSEYLNELGNSPLRKPFSDLTRLYEYIWYGEFPIEKPAFHEAQDSFIRFEGTVKGGKDAR